MEIFVAASFRPGARLERGRFLQSLSAFVDILIYEIVNRFKELIRLFGLVNKSLPGS